MKRKGNHMKGRGIIALGIIAMVIMTTGVASAEKGLTLTTDKSAYNVGESVIITVTNNGDEYVTISNGYVVMGEDGKEIYHPNVLCYMPSLAPGETYDYTWDQICDDGRQAPPGDYEIHTSWNSVEVKLFDSSLNSSPGHGGRNAVELPVPITSSTLA